MNIITIFSGSHTPTGSSTVICKGDFEVAGDYILSRDLTQLKTSEVKVIDKDRVIEAQDIILFTHNNKVRFGKVFEVEKKLDVATIYFTYGIDSHQMELPFYLATQNLDATGSPPIFDNRQDLMLAVDKRYAGSYRITAPDNFISIDTALRQYARRSHLAEEYSVTRDENYDVTRFLMLLTDFNIGGYNPEWTNPITGPLNIRLDDPYIQKSFLLKIGTDKMTRLRLHNQDNLAQYVDYQLLNDGSIVTNTTTATTPWYNEFSSLQAVNANAVKAQRFYIKEAPSDLYNNLEYAKDQFYQNEYDNEIEIEVPEDNPYFRLNTEDENGEMTAQGTLTVDTLLGRKVKVYLPDSDVFIDTFVSGYEISRGTMKIIFGLARSRLTDVINNFVNNDNV